MKVCSKCKRLLALNEFTKDSRRKDGLNLYCSYCTRQIHKEEYKRRREEHIDKGKSYRKQLRQEVLSHYSLDTVCCSVCGNTDIRVLSLDHINGDGAVKRKAIGGAGYKYYLWLRANNYPVGYQVLCMNCQWIKREVNHEGYTTPQRV